MAPRFANSLRVNFWPREGADPLRSSSNSGRDEADAKEHDANG